MATAAKFDPYPHIVSTPGVRAGRPCIDGTRIAVIDVVDAHQMGESVESLCNYFSSRPLTLAEIYAALAYYHDHKAELDAEAEEDARVFDEERQQREDYVRALADKRQ